MITTRRLIAGAAALGMGAMAVATTPAQTDAERLNFVSCPIVRDTSTVPCWLTEYEGELYYMGIQTDVSAPFNPPYLGHRVLVEATVSDAPRICGGIVLEPIRISVMPELDGSCATRLPAEDRYTIDFNPRPPGPSGGRLAFDYPAAPEQERPPVRERREFVITYDFDQTVAFRHPPAIMEIAEYATAIDAGRLSVDGSRGATLLTGGTLLVESEDIGERRARQVADLLAGVGVETEINATWSAAPAPADGIDDWRSRSVRVIVEP